MSVHRRLLPSFPSFPFFRWGTVLPLAALLAAGLGAPLASAQTDAAAFPAAAVRFVDTELPAMNAAVAARDHEYFEGAMARTVELADQWGFKTRSNPALEPYKACMESVTELVVVGLCRLVPTAPDCTPQLASAFESNLASCRTQAKR